MTASIPFASLILPHLTQLEPYQAGKPLEELQRELGLTDAIKLASNENPLGPSPLALAAIRDRLAAHRYPDSPPIISRKTWPGTTVWRLSS
jgi:histidinol-phosphate aminotransferase